MPEYIPDGQLSFEGGQDSSFPPSRLPENKFASGFNISTESGTIRPRYGFERKRLTFQPGGYAYKFNKVVAFDRIFKSGNFQTFAPYIIGNQVYVVVVVSGIIFLVDVKTYNVTCLTLNTDTQLNSAVTRINWSAAGRFLVLYDYPARPIIIDGVRARRSEASAYEVPVSKLGAYNQNRLHVANAGNEFVSGDVVGNPLTPDAPITYEEVFFPSAPYIGDTYTLPSMYNMPITAMGSLEQVDSATGIGPLFVASVNEVWAYRTDIARSEWTKSTGWGVRILNNIGVVGPRAFTSTDADVFFVSKDGRLRSMTVAQQEQGKWARVPMDIQVADATRSIDTTLDQFSAVTYFRNKIFRTVRPYRVYAQNLDTTRNLDVAHQGLVVLETDNLSRLGSDSAPAWAGVWTGVQPMDMAVVDDRMFVLSKDGGSNALYEVDPEVRLDRSETGARRRIKGVVYTREHFFQNAFSLKDLHTIELGVSDIKGKFIYKIEYKPSHSPAFHKWVEWCYDSPYRYCKIPSDGNIPELSAVPFRELISGIPDQTTGNPVTHDDYGRVKRVQLRITIESDSWTLNEYKINAVAVKENATEALGCLPPTPVITTCVNDWLYKEFGLELLPEDE